jgi:hypothetical protein
MPGRTKSSRSLSRHAPALLAAWRTATAADRTADERTVEKSKKST